jgi:hypothetical protein
LSIRTNSGLLEIQIGVAPVILEMQVMLDQGSARIGIVSDSIAMDDGIDQRQRKKEKQEENSLKLHSAVWML